MAFIDVHEAHRYQFLLSRGERTLYDIGIIHSMA